MKLAKMLAAFSQMVAFAGHDLNSFAAVAGRGHGSAGYATPGAFGRSRLGARRSVRRSARILEGKYTQR